MERQLCGAQQERHADVARKAISSFKMSKRKRNIHELLEPLLACKAHGCCVFDINILIVTILCWLVRDIIRSEHSMGDQIQCWPYIALFVGPYLGGQCTRQ